MPKRAPALRQWVSPKALDTLVNLALDEDLGTKRRDITSACIIAEGQPGQANIVAREAGTLAGGSLIDPIAWALDAAVEVQVPVADGQQLQPAAVIATIRGPLRSLLAIERTVLNFMTHLCGIATTTAQYVQAVAATKAQIWDTRKTHPGIRMLEKYAVACGGGHNHRLGLFDAILFKDNHIAHLTLEQLPASLSSAIARARTELPRPKFVEVEVDTVEQLSRVLPCSPDMVLLDNMKTQQLTESVRLRDRLAPHVQLEASGGITLINVAEIARSGVDIISVGALTHSAPALDLAMDIKACGSVASNRSRTSRCSTAS